jgi:hypothetical protein
MAKYLNISKLDAAKRELEMAISLFLSNSDIVCIHSLTASAHNLLRDLGKKQGIKSFTKDIAVDMVKPEKRDEFRKTITKADNFFKHADRDEGEILKFYFRATEIVLWDACRMYHALTKELPPLIQIYNAWFYFKNPDMLEDEKAQQLFKKATTTLDQENRKQFLDLLPYAIREKSKTITTEQL